MNYEVGFEGLKLTLSVALLSFAYFVAYRQARLIEYRQDLFIIRNRLWDFARRMGQADSGAHRRLRHAANGLIRTAPATNLMTLIPMMVFCPRGRTKRSVGDEIESISDAEFRNGLRAAHVRLTRRVLKYVFLQTFPGSLIGWPGKVVRDLYRIAKRTYPNRKAEEKELVKVIMRKSSYRRIEGELERSFDDELCLAH